MDIIKEIKEYIVYNDSRTTLKFKNVQEKERYLRKTDLFFEKLTLEDLNSVIDLVDFDQKSGKFFSSLYSSKISKLYLDIDVTKISLKETYAIMNERIEHLKNNSRASQLIYKIIGQGICTLLKLFKDEEIIEFVKTENEHFKFIANYIVTIYNEYYASGNKITYGLSEYTIKNVLLFIQEKSESLNKPI
ncbi:MAG TPA: hypothetical protein PKD00_00340 [Burkholderiales bacterium]|nr:hypothetical protein [Burkholderiales bacterium]